jgi:hypothetical protein
MKKARMGNGANGIVRQKTSGKDDLWTFDLIFDRPDPQVPEPGG